MDNDNEHKQDYQQEPNHNHEQKHQHNHERESINTGDAIYFLSTHEHEGLAVVSISVERNAEAHISFQVFCSSLLNIGKRIDESGAIIGHIKAVATSKNHATSFSLTDINVAPTINGSKCQTGKNRYDSG